MYGLKPTHNRLGTMQNSMCVTAPMAATPADLTAAYRIMAQPDPSCSTQSLFAPSQPLPPSAKKTIGICRAWNERAAPSVREACDAAIAHYQTLGYSVVDITLPHLREAQLAHGATCITEMASVHYARAPSVRAAHAMLAPQARVLVATGRQTPAGDYIAFQRLRELLMQHVAHLFSTHPNLLIVSPTTPLAGWPKDVGDESHGFSDANKSLENMLYVFLANVTGCPAVTAPVGYVEAAQGVGRVPVGLMAMGEWGSEEALLAWAREAGSYLDGLEGGRRRPRAWVDVLDVGGDGKKSSGEEAKE